MAFTKIKADKPVTIPQQAEKQYDKLWMESFRVVAKTPTSKATVIAHMIPYDGTGNVLTTQKKLVTIDDLFTKAQKRTDMAQAMDMVFQAIDSWIQDKKWFDETVQPVINKQNQGQELTQEELDLITEAQNKALI